MCCDCDEFGYEEDSCTDMWGDKVKTLSLQEYAALMARMRIQITDDQIFLYDPVK